MSDWHSLVGKFGQRAGVSGTETIPFGAVILTLTVHSTSGGSFTLFGGPSVAVIANAAPLQVEFPHTLVQSTQSNSGQIVFTGTDHYWITYVQQGYGP